MPERGIFEKIISGGQTGADQGALDAALRFGHPCGGWCPKGRKSEAGRIPDKYLLQEHESEDYSARTEKNIADSDGTLVFTYGEPAGGTALTVNLARKLGKPLFIYDLQQKDVNTGLKEVWLWGLDNNVHVLNVAGPRESWAPGTRTLVETVMSREIEFARRCFRGQ